jgi:hypothetical protein
VVPNPWKVGRFSLVRLSKLDAPVSAVAIRSGVGGTAGGVLSMVTLIGEEAELRLPAGKTLF